MDVFIAIKNNATHNEKDKPDITINNIANSVSLRISLSVSSILQYINI